MPETPQTGAGVFPMKRHRKPLPEHSGARGFGFELASSQSRIFGKLGPDPPRRIAPATANGFDDHRDESDALGLAFTFRVPVRRFEVFVPARDIVGRSSAARRQIHAEAAGDGEIPSGGRPRPPSWDIHVSGPPGPREGVLLLYGATVLVSGPDRRPLGQKAWFFEFRTKVGACSRIEGHVP